MGLRLPDILWERSLQDQSLQLVFQMPTLIGTMPVVLMELAVLTLVSSFYRIANWLKPLQGGIVIYLHKDLLNWHY